MAVSTSGSRSVTPSHGPGGLAEHRDRLAPDRPLGVDPLDRGRGEARAPPPRPRRAGRARAGARSRATGRSRPRRCRGRAAAARGRTRGAPSRTAARCRCRARAGRPTSQRSIVALASGRPAASSPVTPNRRRIARSWPMVVEARARAPHAPASAAAWATSRSSGPQSAFMRTVGTASVARGSLSPARPDPRAGSSRAVWPARPGGWRRIDEARHRSTIDASRLPARKPR